MVSSLSSIINGLLQEFYLPLALSASGSVFNPPPASGNRSGGLQTSTSLLSKIQEMLGLGGSNSAFNSLWNSPASNANSGFSLPTDPHKKQIMQMATQVAQEHGIPSNIFLSVLQHESDFNPNCVGDHGTSFGLGQIHTPAHPDYDVQRGKRDPRYQLDYSASLLRNLYDRNGSWSKAVERYNGAGPHAVQYSQIVMRNAAKFS